MVIYSFSKTSYSLLVEEGLHFLNYTLIPVIAVFFFELSDLLGLHAKPTHRVVWRSMNKHEADIC